MRMPSTERNKEEDTILETLKQEMGLKHVIRVCASSEQDKVVDAAKRLLQHQKQFKAAGIKLEGQCNACALSLVSKLSKLARGNTRDPP